MPTIVILLAIIGGVSSFYGIIKLLHIAASFYDTYKGYRSAKGIQDQLDKANKFYNELDVIYHKLKLENRRLEEEVEMLKGRSAYR